jgi:hypothetical protein
MKYCTCSGYPDLLACLPEVVLGPARLAGLPPAFLAVARFGAAAGRLRIGPRALAPELSLQVPWRALESCTAEGGVTGGVFGGVPALTKGRETRSSSGVRGVLLRSALGVPATSRGGLPGGVPAPTTRSSA